MASLGGWVVGSSWESPVIMITVMASITGRAVYMNGQPLASSEEYYQQASDLATSASPSQAVDTEWLPLGVFRYIERPGHRFEYALAARGRQGWGYSREPISYGH